MWEHNVACDHGLYSSFDQEKRTARESLTILKTKINVIYVVYLNIYFLLHREQTTASFTKTNRWMLLIMRYPRNTSINSVNEKQNFLRNLKSSSRGWHRLKYCNVTLCPWESISDVSKDRTTFIFRVNQSKDSSRVGREGVLWIVPKLRHASKGKWVETFVTMCVVGGGGGGGLKYRDVTEVLI